MSEKYPEFDNKKILIVGGAGFVGSNLVKMILSNSNPAEIIVVDNLLSSEEFNLPENSCVNFIKGSIVNDNILNKFEDNIDYVFHLATYHGNQSSIADPIADHENNTLPTLKLMNYFKDFKNIKKIVYSAAGCAVAKKTFDSGPPVDEDAEISLNHDSPYSLSKLFGEFYSVYFYKKHGLPTIRARFQNVYGPGEILGAGEWRGTPATIWRNVVPTFIYKALTKNQLPLENNGIATRDFIYVDDICHGLILCAINGKFGDAYNLASGKETSIYDLAVMINEITSNSQSMEIKEKRPWDNSGKRYGSTEKSKRELGFVSNTELFEGLKYTVNWTNDNMSSIKKCMLKHKDHVDSLQI